MSIVKKISGFLCTAVLGAAMATSLTACANSSGSVNNNNGNVRSLIAYETDDTAVESSLADTVERVEGSVVAITTEQTVSSWAGQYVTQGAGSGVIIDIEKADNKTTAYIITNHHVIEGAEQITITMYDDSTSNPASFSGAELVGTDAAEDIAVVKFTTDDAFNYPKATFGDSDSLRTGESVFAIGNPLGTLGGTVTAGIVSSLERNLIVNNYTMNLIQTDTAINPGNSGGALFNSSGVLVGIVNAKSASEGVEGICFAIPINDAKATYTELKAKGYVSGRASLGVSVSSGTISMSSSTVVYVTESGDNSLELYDLIVSINGTEIDSLLAYHNAMMTLAPNDSVTVVVRAGSKSGMGISFSTETETKTVTATQLKKGETL